MTFCRVRTTVGKQCVPLRLFNREIYKLPIFLTIGGSHALAKRIIYRFARWIRLRAATATVPSLVPAPIDEGERERGDLVLTEGIRNPCTYSYQRCDDFSLTIASTERGWPTIIRDRPHRFEHTVTRCKKKERKIKKKLKGKEDSTECAPKFWRDKKTFL